MESYGYRCRLQIVKTRERCESGGNDRLFLPLLEAILRKHDPRTSVPVGSEYYFYADFYGTRRFRCEKGFVRSGPHISLGT
jgi:hypothetical protein